MAIIFLKEKEKILMWMIFLLPLWLFLLVDCKDPQLGRFWSFPTPWFILFMNMYLVNVKGIWHGHKQLSGRSFLSVFYSPCCFAWSSIFHRDTLKPEMGVRFLDTRAFTIHQPSFLKLSAFLWHCIPERWEMHFQFQLDREGEKGASASYTNDHPPKSDDIFWATQFNKCNIYTRMKKVEEKQLSTLKMMVNCPNQSPL